jgi:hypothetical protein
LWWQTRRYRGYGAKDGGNFVSEVVLSGLAASHAGCRGRRAEARSQGGVLQSISEKYKIEVARFQGEMTAERRTEERQRQDGWGDYRMIKTTWLDVSIPFVGEAETLRIGPSSMTLLDRRATIGRNTLTISVTDDDRTEAIVQNFKQMVEGNLQTLRGEYERNKPQLEQAIQQGASQRQAQIEAEDARDKGRSFRVTN